MTSVSSIIALNTDSPDRLGPEPDDVVASFSFTSNTLLQDTDGAESFLAGAAGNLSGLDPRLGPLQDNGGPTPTMALQPGSPAIDAGSNPLDLTADQRGYKSRVVGAAADMGAYEFGAVAPPNGGGPGGGGPGGGNPGGGNPGGTGGGGTAFVPIGATIIQVKHHRAIRVTDPATGLVKFSVYPFGSRYRGRFAISTVTVDGVEDLVVRRPVGHKKFATAVFSGIDGSPLPSSLA